MLFYVNIYSSYNIVKNGPFLVCPVHVHCAQSAVNDREKRSLESQRSLAAAGCQMID